MTTPDNQEFDPQDFNLEEWLSVGTSGRASETVTVYNDLTLFDQAKDLAARIRKANEKEEEEDLALTEKSEISKLNEEQDRLTQKINNSRVEVEIISLSDQEIEDLTDSFTKKHGSTDELQTTVKGTCWILAEAATFNGRKITAEQWEKVADIIAGGQWQTVKQTWIKVQGMTPRVSAPLSRGTSRLSKAARP